MQKHYQSIDLASITFLIIQVFDFLFYFHMHFSSQNNLLDIVYLLPEFQK